MRTSIVLGCVSCLAAVVGCSSTNSGGSPQDAGGQETSTEVDSGGGDGGTESDSGADSEAGMAGDCTLPAAITANMTLTTACPVWHVTASGTVVGGSGSPVLTIDAGVTVAFDKGGFLSIGVSDPGGVVAVGTANAPIAFTSGAMPQAAGDWSAVALGEKVLSTSTIAYASFEYGSGIGSGGNTSSQDGYSYGEPAGALIVYSGSQSLGIVLHDLTFSHDAGNGLVVDGFNVGFGSGSGNLTVSDWGTGFAPLVIAANQGSTLPTSLTAKGGIVDLIAGQGAPGTPIGGAAPVGLTQTWPAIPIPYLVDGTVPGSGGGAFVEGSGNGVATLTIAAPNTLEFKSGGILAVDPNGTAQGQLVAVGTSGSPITFTSNVASPSPGAWGGVEFSAPNSGGSALASSKLQGVVIDWAGGGALTQGSDTAVISIDGLTQGSSGPVLSGCTIENYPSTACGIVYTSTFITPPSPGYAPPNNTFTGTNTVCAL